MENKDIINFINSIIRKKFSTKPNGYNPNEVDEILDEIFKRFSYYISDYENLVHDYKIISEENEKLKKEIKELETKNKILQSNINKLESSGISFNMMNERISRLEEQAENKKNNNKSNEK